MAIALSALATLGACSRLVERPGPQFVFDPDVKFRLGLGWGSGWHGLETFELDPEGGAVLVRGLLRQGWQRATLALREDQIRSVALAVMRFDVPGMKRLYEDPGMCDGEQWVLCLEQAGQKRVVYCNNHFAPGIREFRDALLAIVDAPALPWTPLPPDESITDHAQQLWQENRDAPIDR